MDGPVPEILDLPIGIDATGLRRESDALGAIDVPADRYWGAQTQRSLEHFSIGDDHMPPGIHHAYGHVKMAAALVNGKAGRLPGWLADLIARVAAEVVSGDLDEHFPLFVWQTGSGTQTNMNVNEVISNRAIQLVGGTLGSKTPVHPNDHVNLGQSSNDSFPTATHVAAVLALHDRVLPELRALHAALDANAGKWADVPKTGRTHLQDAVPLTVGQEWSGYAAQIAATTARLETALPGLYELAAGGTAVGTGLNAPRGFAGHFAAELAELTGHPFVTAPNKFAALAGADAMAAASAGLRGVATALHKIANDVRWLGSGPRTGLGELRLPENEPGSSIMPGKVNPTQCEATMMVCTRVLADDSALAHAAASGSFELNTMRPLIASSFLHSARILTDAARNFRVFCLEGIELNRERIDRDLGRSLMLVTALTPEIGYDKAAQIAHSADTTRATLREAAIASGFLSAEEFDRIVDPRAMTVPPDAE
ncbi:class II fumarate hydratase [Catenulispora yoronensis]|uniref:Fumarate hydratase class II n=1 Tax=Catenulispora yoronensis TaxID=450799 RepID=A0ABP5H2N7_9ACTN